MAKNINIGKSTTNKQSKFRGYDIMKIRPPQIPHDIIVIVNHYRVQT